MSDRPMILGLDISKTRTGVCCGRIGETPRFASVVGNDMDDAASAWRLFKWLTDFTKAEKIDACFIEAQISFGAFMGCYDEESGKVQMTSNPKTTLAIAKMVGAAEIVMRGRGIMTREPAVSTVRKAVLGNGRLPGKQAKAAMRRLCLELGWTPSNLDESDAAGVWFYGCLQLRPSACQVVTPMMQAKVISEAGGSDAFAR